MVLRVEEGDVVFAALAAPTGNGRDQLSGCVDDLLRTSRFQFTWLCIAPAHTDTGQAVGSGTQHVLRLVPDHHSLRGQRGECR